MRSRWEGGVAENNVGTKRWGRERRSVRSRLMEVKKGRLKVVGRQLSQARKRGQVKSGGGASH